MTLATVLVLALLACSCLRIYLEGRTPIFTAALVQERLRPLLPVLAVYAVLVVGALILASLEETPRSRAAIVPEDRLKRMKARIEVLPEEARVLERQRRTYCLLAIAAALVCAVPCLIYLLDRSHFTDWDLEHVMGQMLLHVAPWVVLAFGAVIAASMACGRSVRRETEILKGLPGKAKSPEAAPCRKNYVNLLRALLYGLAAAFIVLGVMNGGMRDVLVKAINICTECIGLG